MESGWGEIRMMRKLSNQVEIHTKTDWIGDEGEMSMRINIVEEQKTMADDTGPTTTQKLDWGGGGFAPGENDGPITF